MQYCQRRFRLSAVPVLFSVIGLAGCGGGGAAPQPPAEPPAPTQAAAPSGPGGAGGSAVAAAEGAPRGAAATQPFGAAAPRTAAFTGDDEQALQLIAESVTLKNNLKTIVLGLHNHHDAYLSFIPSLDNPRAYDEQKRPRFSWRVAVLPYIDQAPLYNQYNFDEPWDSEQNKAVLNQMPDVFRTPGEAGSNTRMLMVVGEGTAVEPGKREARVRDITDGLSNTLLVVHVGTDKAVPWTKPDDLPFDPLAVRGMFGDVGESMVLATADGVVHKIRADAPEAELRNLITRNDHNPIDLAALHQPDVPLPWMSTPPRSGPLVTAYMPDDCFGVVVVRPKRLINSDLVKQFAPPEVLEQLAAGAPVDPRNVEEIVLWLAPPDPTGDTVGKIGGAAIRFTEPVEFPPPGMSFGGGQGGGIGPFSSTTVAEPIAEDAPASIEIPSAPAEDAAPAEAPLVDQADAPALPGEFPGIPPDGAMPMRPGLGGPDLPFSPDQFYRHDDRTLVFGSQFRLYKLLSGKQPPAALAERATQAEGDLVVLVDTSDGQLIQRIAQAIPQDDPNAQALMFGAALFLSPFANSNLVEINLDLSGDNLFTLRSECKTPEDAQKLQQAIQGFAMMGSQNEQAPPELGEFLSQLQYSANGNTGVVALLRSDAVIKMIAEGIGAALQQMQSAGRGTGQSNNLKLIGLSYHNMYDVYRGPRPWSVPDDHDADGKPYLSWRVHALPFLDEGALHEQFHLNEPWDSPHNKALLDVMPDVYRFTDEGDPTQTQVVFLTGPHTMFDGEINGRFEKITDGTSNTILALVVPAEKAVPWTQPLDAVFDPDDPLSVVRPISPDGIRVLFADGHIDTLPADIDADTFKALVTPAGGEPVLAP